MALQFYTIIWTLLGQANLLSRINSIIDENTKIILISATVFDADFHYLIENGINVINKEMIDFPGSGRQIKFRDKMIKLLNNCCHNMT